MSLRILYIVSTINNNIGGHYYSLEATASALSATSNTKILIIGNQTSPVFNNTDIKTYFIKFNISKLIKIKKQIAKIISANNIQILHAFDYTSLFFARLMHHLTGIPYLYMRCGGAIPKIFPYAKNIILYSEENLSYFQNKKKYKNSNINFIPNRVKPFQPDLKRIEYLKKNINYNEKDIIFLRISRISSNYLQTFRQIVFLADKLVQDGLPIKLVIIGNQERDSDAVIKELDLYNKPYIFLFTDSKYTLNAKEIIGVCDFYIGTGRGIMEACSQKKVVLTPLRGKNFPVIISEDNILNFFNTNFSERNELMISDDQIYTDIFSVIKDKDRQNDLKLFSYKMFTKYFDITSVINRYHNIYMNLIASKQKDSFFALFDLFRHFILICQSILFTFKDKYFS
jgi:glycosyltransferase involved in cell wall biosynthesis